MVPTGFRSSALASVLVFLALGSCDSYQSSNFRPRTGHFGVGQRSFASACPKLSVGAADFDSDIEAALGQASVSEYERDAEFYRKRNEQYYDSLQKANDEKLVVSQLSASDATNAVSSSSSDEDQHENPRWVTDSIHTSSKAAQKSFRFVEKTTFSLLYEKPMLALAIFVAAGMMVAYMSGFFFLDGYIENWNPVENDIIPYWDDAEIHTIERAMPPEM